MNIFLYNIYAHREIAEVEIEIVCVEYFEIPPKPFKNKSLLRLGVI